MEFSTGGPIGWRSSVVLGPGFMVDFEEVLDPLDTDGSQVLDKSKKESNRPIRIDLQLMDPTHPEEQVSRERVSEDEGEADRRCRGLLSIHKIGSHSTGENSSNEVHAYGDPTTEVSMRSCNTCIIVDPLQGLFFECFLSCICSN